MWGSHGKEYSGLVLGPLLAMSLYALLPDALAADARMLASILACVVIWWITEPIPLPITALLGSGACVVMGLGSMKSIFSPYAHPIIFLFIGSFLLAEALVVHGLDRRFGIWLLSFHWIGNRPTRIAVAIGIAVAGLSMWISNTAAAALMVPIVLGVLTTMRDKQDAPATYETGMLLLVAYAASVGGVATIIGTPPNLIGVGLLAEQANISLSFMSWMLVGVPLAVLMLGMIYGVLRWLHPLPADLSKFADSLLHQRATLGPWTSGERYACIGFIVAVVLWLAPGVFSVLLGANHAMVEWYRAHLPKELVPILAAGLLFMLPIDVRRGLFTLSWKQAAKINWGTILLFGGGLSFGHLMIRTNLAKTVGESLVYALGVESVWGLTAVAIMAAIVLTEIASNTAAASMIVPVVIAIAQSAGVSPVPPTLGACMAASLAFVLPVSTPPNGIVYGTGRVPILSMIRAGLLLDLFGGLLIWSALRVLCPLVGLN